MFQLPLYHACDNIAGYAAAILAHYRIKAKTGAIDDDKTKSLVFLQNIGHPNVTNSLPIWIHRITNYYGSGDLANNGSLPDTLRIPGLALELSKMEKATAKAQDPTHATGRRVNNLIMPSMYESRLTDIETQLTNLSNTSQTQMEEPPTICRIQGYNEDHHEYDATINALYNDRSRDDGRNRSRDDGRHRSRDDGRTNDFKPRRKPPTKRRTTDLSVICEACKSNGHKAAECILLARAIWVLKYMKKDQKLTELIAKKWDDKSKATANINMANAFCKENNKTVDKVASELSIGLEEILEEDM